MTVYSKPAVDLLLEKAVAAERERCAKIADARAQVWNNDANGICSFSLLEECEDIAAAIRRATK